MIVFVLTPELLFGCSVGVVGADVEPGSKMAVCEGKRLMLDGCAALVAGPLFVFEGLGALTALVAVRNTSMTLEAVPHCGRYPGFKSFELLITW